MSSYKGSTSGKAIKRTTPHKRGYQAKAAGKLGKQLRIKFRLRAPK